MNPLADIPMFDSPVFDSPIVDIIVPVFNERDNLPDLLARLSALPDFAQFHLIFVDNASTDGSVEFIQSVANASVILHTHNRGYGASLRSGIAAARTEQIVIIDADCEYPPECIPVLLRALVDHNVVYASRLQGKSTARQAGMLPLKWWGNRIISTAYNILFTQNTTDLYTGCKALRRSCLNNIQLQRNGFEQVLELAAKLAACGYRIAEVPVDFSPRARGQSKMVHLSETLKYFFWLVFYRLQLSQSSSAAVQEAERGKQ